MTISPSILMSSISTSSSESISSSSISSTPSSARVSLLNRKYDVSFEAFSVKGGANGLLKKPQLKGDMLVA